jgi:hypothetical protein
MKVDRRAFQDMFCNATGVIRLITHYPIFFSLEFTAIPYRDGGYLDGELQPYLPCPLTFFFAQLQQKNFPRSPIVEDSDPSFLFGRGGVPILMIDPMHHMTTLISVPKSTSRNSKLLKWTPQITPPQIIVNCKVFIRTLRNL